MKKSVNFFNKEIVEILKSLLLFELVSLFLFYFYSCDEGYAGARCERVDLFYLRGDRGQILVICLIAVMVILYFGGQYLHMLSVSIFKFNFKEV